MTVESMNLSFRPIDVALRRRSAYEINAAAFLLVVIIAVAAYLLGYEITTSTFFLVPIALVTWYGGYRRGIFFAVLCAFIWHLVDTVIAAHPYSHPGIPYWNTGVRLGLFLITALLLTRFKFQLSNEKNLSRTDSLTGV
ncbi:MAG: hypothetical protein ABIS30_08065, partial [Gallionella sp.]